MKRKIINSTPFGPMVIIWERFNGLPQVVRVLISKPGLSAVAQAAKLFTNLQTASCREIEAVSRKILSRLRGRDVKISPDILDFKQCSLFQCSVLRLVCRIPRGKVSTYQLVAGNLGKKKAVRAVGSALAKNPFPVILPCHRVIRAGLQPGGFQGGSYMKQALLKEEGIIFGNTGRAACILPRYIEKQIK
ncbi:MAG: MGMT family protein [Candidatus Omnitrophica bacterium]|jgi:methylated-DNA-[protein]-cysteine S-methyltransferase|nr:MGMT family protein [Candidatus Omnitrophota bacterium]